MLRPLCLFAVTSLLVACGTGSDAAPSGSASAPVASARSAGSAGASKSSASASGSPASSGSASAASSSPPVLDPAIAPLTKDTFACKFESGRFTDCKAFDEWRSSSADALKGDKGDALIFAMFFDADERVRVLAAARTITSSSKVFADKANAERMFAQIAKETNKEVRDTLAAYIGDFDVDKLGLGAELRTLAKNPTADVRRSLGYRMLFHATTPLAFELAGAMLADPDKEVRKAAAMGLSNSAVFHASAGCKLLADALDTPNGGDVIWSASSLDQCKGLQAKVLDAVDAKTKKVSEVTNDVGIDYSLALDGICHDPSDGPKQPAALKKKAFEVAKRLASSECPDPNTRHAALSTLVHCDPVAAKAELEKLAKDKESFIADGAKEQLADLAKPKK